MQWTIVTCHWNSDEKSLSKWPQLQLCEYLMSIMFYKEQQILLGLLLMLVTLHGRYIISVEQDNYNW